MSISKKGLQDEINLLMTANNFLRGERNMMRGEYSRKDIEVALAKETIASLQVQVASLMETNRKLNRRVSQVESPWQKERDRNLAKKLIWKKAWEAEFMKNKTYKE